MTVVAADSAAGKRRVASAAPASLLSFFLRLRSHSWNDRSPWSLHLSKQPDRLVERQPAAFPRQEVLTPESLLVHPQRRLPVLFARGDPGAGAGLPTDLALPQVPQARGLAWEPRKQLELPHAARTPIARPCRIPGMPRRYAESHEPAPPKGWRKGRRFPVPANNGFGLWWLRRLLAAKGAGVR